MIPRWVEMLPKSVVKILDDIARRGPKKRLSKLELCIVYNVARVAGKRGLAQYVGVTENTVRRWIQKIQRDEDYIGTCTSIWREIVAHD